MTKTLRNLILLPSVSTLLSPIVGGRLFGTLKSNFAASKLLGRSVAGMSADMYTSHRVLSRMAEFYRL